MIPETRSGVRTMAATALALLLGSLVAHESLGLGASWVYTVGLLGALCLHVFWSASQVDDLGSLHMLGMALIAVSGMGFVLTAHQMGSLGAVLFTSLALLYMITPLVPWGLREAAAVTGLLYGLVSASTWTVAERFDDATLWALQALLSAGGLTTLVLVGRATLVRRADLAARFELDRAHEQVKHLSLVDTLTEAWNRRYLASEFGGFVERIRKAETSGFLALIDVDNFKTHNDERGHSHGDAVLSALSLAFRTRFADTGHLVRTGGDEFVVLIESEGSIDFIEDAYASLCAHLAHETPSANAQVGLSIGLLEIAPSTSLDLEEAILLADGALYRAKEASRLNNAPGLHLHQTAAPPRSSAGACGPVAP